jgi:pimeloyl-ACP methyl ester carboxylesterase
MKRELPNSRLIRLKKIGHSPTLEAPEQVLPAVVEFFREPNISATA